MTQQLGAFQMASIGAIPHHGLTSPVKSILHERHGIGVFAFIQELSECLSCGQVERKFKDIEAVPVLSLCTEVRRQRLHFLSHALVDMFRGLQSQLSMRLFDCKLQTNLGYIGKPCLKTNKNQSSQTTNHANNNNKQKYNTTGKYQEWIKKNYSGMEDCEFKEEGTLFCTRVGSSSRAPKRSNASQQELKMKETLRRGNYYEINWLLESIWRIYVAKCGREAQIDKFRVDYRSFATVHTDNSIVFILCHYTYFSKIKYSHITSLHSLFFL